MSVVIERPDVDLLNRAVAASALTDSDEAQAAYLETAGTLVFVARERDEVRGWCWGQMIPRPEGGRMAYLHRLEVDEPFRRRGIARDFVRAFMAAAVERGATTMFLTTNAGNRPVRALYDSLGGGHSDFGPTVNYWFVLREAGVTRSR